MGPSGARPRLVCSTTPVALITRRSDGGHTLAISGRGRVDPSPQLLRFAPSFLPMFAKRERWQEWHRTSFCG